MAGVAYRCPNKQFYCTASYQHVVPRRLIYLLDKLSDIILGGITIALSTAPLDAVWSETSLTGIGMSSRGPVRGRRRVSSSDRVVDPVLGDALFESVVLLLTEVWHHLIRSGLRLAHRLITPCGRVGADKLVVCDSASPQSRRRTLGVPRRRYECYLPAR